MIPADSRAHRSFAAALDKAPRAGAFLLALLGVVFPVGPLHAQGAPDIAVQKSANGPIYIGRVVDYGIAVRNVGSGAAGAVTVVDDLPTGILAPVAASGAGWSCSIAGQRVTCTRPSLAAGTSAPTITLQASVSATLTAGRIVRNAARATTSGDASSANNLGVSEEPAVTPPPTPLDLTISKQHVAPFAVGQNGTYTIAVTNAGQRPTSGAITVTDALPAGLSFVSGAGSNWSCGATGSSVTCTNPGPLAVGATTTFSLVVAVALPAYPSVTNTATVSTPTETVTNNNSATAVTPVSATVDVAIAKTVVSPFGVGANGSYTLTVTNVGQLPTQGATTVTDALPAGLTFVSATGTGWSCSAAGANVTCSYPAPLPAGGSSSIALTVAVGTAAYPSVINTAVVSTPQDANAANNTSTVQTPVTSTVDVAIAKTTTSSFLVGANATYALAVTNLSPLVTQGATTVNDVLPAGLDFVSASGTGWSCSATGNAVSCSHPAAIAVGATTTISLVVAVRATAPAQVTNTATVSATNDVNPTNNTSSVTSPVVRPFDISIVKSTASGFSVGANAAYALQVRNLGPNATAGIITVTDRLPNGLTFVSAAGSGWSCGAAGQDVTCTTAASLAVGASSTISLTVAVNAAARPEVVNTGIVSASGDTDPTNNRSTVTTPIDPAPVLDLSITKSSTALTRGSDGTFTLRVANVGDLPTTASIVVTDQLPAGVAFVAASGPDFTCSHSAGLVTCTRTNALPVGAAVSIVITVRLVDPSLTQVVNTGVVKTAGDNNPTNDSSTITVPVGGTVGDSPDLRMDKKVVGTAVAGGTATFDLDIKNIGIAPTYAEVVVTDVLPAGLTLVSASGAGWTCTTTGATLTCRSTSVIPPQGSSVIRVVANVGANVRSITNTATVKTPGDGNPDNDTDTENVPFPNVQFIDLAVLKLADQQSFTPGTPGSYTIRVTNVGNASTVGPITLTDVLPAGLTFVSATGTGWTCSASGQTITCTNPGPLAAGASTTIAVRVNVAPTASGTVLNVANVTTPGDGNPDNDQSTVSTPVVTNVDLALTKRGPATVSVGETAAWTLTVRNVGTTATTGTITVTDTLPAGLTFEGASGADFSCSVTGQVVTCTRTVPLAAGASVDIGVTARGTAAMAQSLTNTACARTSGDANAANDCGQSTSTRLDSIDVSIVKIATSPFQVGRQGTYQLTVRNTGTGAAAAPIAVRDTLPNGLTFASATGAGWTCTATGNVVTCTRNTPLDAGASSTIDLRVTIASAALPAVTNCAHVSAANETGSTINNRSCDTTSVIGEPKLEIRKEVSRVEAAIGDVLDYTITVTNVGTADVPDAIVRDDLPNGFSYVERTARVGGSTTAEPAGAPGPRLVFSIGRVGVNGVVSLTYRVRVGAGAQVGYNTNVAVASGRDGTPTSPQGRARTRIVGGLFDERGAIVGKVFTQCNCASAMQEGGEVGIPGVRVYLEDGTAAVTDVEGKYSFYNVASRLHAVKIDRNTLPKGATMVALGSRNAGDGWSRFADVKAGELHRADFAEGSGSADVLRAVLERRRAGEVENAGAQIRDGAAPTAGAAAGTAGVAGADTTTLGNAYRPLLDNASLNERNSQLPATPLRAQQMQKGMNPSASAGRVRLEVPHSGIPADGQTMVQVSVSVVDAAGNPLSGRTPATLESSLGRWMTNDLDRTEQSTQVVLENGGGTFTLIAAAQPGRGEVRVTTDQGTMTLPIYFIPVSRPLTMTGLLNARIDFRSLIRGGNALAGDADGFEESIRDFSASSDSGKIRSGARGALFMKGRILGDQLLTLSYDSERDRGRTLFRDIRPEDFYPVYGDASLREFDAQSRRRFYARIDNGSSFTMFGDFQTNRADERRMLSTYDRTLNGAVQHFEGKRGAATLFASRGRSRQVVDELPGRGISGPYTLSRIDGLVNSERVEIITRDRNQPSVILSRRMMTRFADYTIEPVTGRLIFRAPVPSADANLNPVSVRVTYESESAGAESYWVYGGDASLRLGKAVEVGATYANEDNPLQKHEVAGVNATAKLGENTFVMAEAARTDVGGKTGDAQRLEVRHQSEKVDARAFVARSDSAFSNSSSTFIGGRTEMGARGSVAVTEKDRVVAEALRTESTSGFTGKRDGAMLAWQRLISKSWRAEFGYRYAKETGTPTPASVQYAPVDRDVSALRGRLDWTLPENTRSSLFAEYEQDVRDASRRSAIGGEYILANRARLYARHEWLTGVEGPYSTNQDVNQEYTVFGIDADYFKNTQMFSEYRARDAFAGRDAEAAIGLRNRWAVAPGLLINTSFERVQPLASVPGQTTLTSLGDALAVTGAVEWTRPSLWKSTARLEYRDATSGDNLLATFGYARKLTRDWTLLGRTLWDVYDAQRNQTRGWSQLGLAWRQTDRNKWNGLVRYENRLERLGTSGTLLETESNAHILAGLLNYQPMSRLTLSGRYAARSTNDVLGGLSTRTTAQLFMGRGIYDLNSRVDLGLIGSLLASEGLSSRKYGMGGEVGLLLVRNLRLAAGYNLFGFTDKDLNTFGTTRKGAYLELGFKFDETLFGLGGDEKPCDNACRQDNEENE